MVGHSAYMCSKLYDRPKCGKCGRGHKTKKTMDLNVPTVLVWGTLRSGVGRKMEEG